MIRYFNEFKGSVNVTITLRDGTVYKKKDFPAMLEAAETTITFWLDSDTLVSIPMDLVESMSWTNKP